MASKSKQMGIVAGWALPVLFFAWLLAGCSPAPSDDASSSEISDGAEDKSWQDRLPEVEQNYAAKGASATPMHSAAHVSFKVEGIPTNAVPGKDYELTLVLDIAEGWHVNANPASFDFLIPTKLSLEKTPGLRLVSVTYPKGKSYSFPTLEKPLAVYEKTVRIPFRVAVARGVTPGILAAKGRLSVQACDDKTCLAPSQMPVSFTLEIRGS